jgi:predicted short-subunit dehydrogenase-like oxidoreductase (DUF2520 family)
MRQVPGFEHSPFGLVGDGRVARHFQHYFSLLGLPVLTWSRRAAGAPPDTALAACGTVLLLIRDEAIVPFIEAWPRLRTKCLVHCSGALTTPLAAAAHPLMTFGPTLYELAEYQSIPFVLDAGAQSLAELLPGLPNPSYTIPAASRPYYHALSVMAGNFSTLLWLKFGDELETRFGIPPSAAQPYLARMAENIGALGHKALTGPLVRGDRQAVAANLQALEGDPFHAVYAAFVRVYEQRA